MSLDEWYVLAEHLIKLIKSFYQVRGVKTSKYIRLWVVVFNGELVPQLAYKLTLIL